MALIEYRFFSYYLQMQTEVTVLIPGDRQVMSQGISNVYNPDFKYKTLYLLHGAEEDNKAWTRFTSIERYAEERGLAVVLPSAYNSMYENMKNGFAYYDFLSKELPVVMEKMFPLSNKREDTFVAGLSMGGRGAFLWAFREPERFAAAACLSGSLNLETMYRHDIKYRTEGSLKRMYRVLGTEEEGLMSLLRGSDHDVLELAARAKKKGGHIPLLYFACGTEDYRYEEQYLPFVEYARELGLSMCCEEGPGDHEYGFWDRFIERVVKWLPMDAC